MFYFLNLQVIINIKEDPYDGWYQGFMHPVRRGTGALPWSLGVGFAGVCLVAGSLPMGSSQDQAERKIWVHPPVGPPPAGGVKGVWCYLVLVADKGQGALGSDPRLMKLALGTLNITSLVEK